MRKVIAFSAFFAATSSGVYAQDDASEIEALPKLEENSEHCGYSLYSDGPDTLDLQSIQSIPCFDLKAGDDVLNITSPKFAAGAKIYTGPGRDIVAATNGDDYVETFDDMDAKIDLRGGQDELKIKGMLATGITRAGSGDPTAVITGPGTASIWFGIEGFEDVVRTRSPNLNIVTEGSDKVALDMNCGRGSEQFLFDAAFDQVERDTSITGIVDGCSLNFPSLLGSLELAQNGGRLSLTSPRIPGAETFAFLDVTTVRGSSFSGAFESTSALSSLLWNGFGPVSFTGDFVGNSAGGTFAFETMGQVYGKLNLSRGDVSLRAVSGESVELVLEGAVGTNNVSVDIVAPKVDLYWAADYGAFPTMKTGGIASVERIVRYSDSDEERVLAALEAESAAQLEAYEASESYSGGKVRSNSDSIQRPMAYAEMTDEDQAKAYYSAAKGELITSKRDIRTGTVSLALSRSNIGDECVVVQLLDAQNIEEDIRIPCTESAANLFVRDYEVIQILGSNGRNEIAINGSTGFKLDRLEVRD